jgi:hypothetical protein
MLRARLRPAYGAVVADREIVVRGSAPPGGEVRRDRAGFEDKLTAGPDGRWEMSVRLEDGDNRLTFFLQDHKDVCATVAVAQPPASATPPPPSASPATPAPVAAPPYEVARMDLTSTPNRRRYETVVIVPAAYMREQMAAVLADAARRTLRERPDALAAVVFAYSDRSLVDKGFDKGRAWVSRDGRRWTGDGRFMTGPDNNRVHLTVGAAGGPAEELTVPR